MSSRKKQGVRVNDKQRARLVRVYGLAGWGGMKQITGREARQRVAADTANKYRTERASSRALPCPGMPWPALPCPGLPFPALGLPSVTSLLPITFLPQAPGQTHIARRFVTLWLILNRLVQTSFRRLQGICMFQSLVWR